MISLFFTFFTGFWSIFLALALIAFVYLAVVSVLKAIEAGLKKTFGVALMPPLQVLERTLGAFGALLPGPKPVRGLLGVILFCSTLIALAATFGQAQR